MTAQSSLHKICSVMGSYRTFLLGRPISVQYQQCAGLKQSLEEKIGLPQKPRRPLTPYFRFMTEIRPSLTKSNPNLKVTEISKLVGSKWEKLDPSTKQKLDAEFQKDKSVYEQALEKYKNRLSKEDKERLEDAKKQLTNRKEKLKMKNKLKELGKPRRPPSAYLFFASEMLSQRGGAAITEWRSKTASQWASLSDKEKEVYVKKQHTAQESYKRDIRKWEERMIRLGNIDLVRNEVLIDRAPKKNTMPRKK